MQMKNHAILMVLTNLAFFVIMIVLFFIGRRNLYVDNYEEEILFLFLKEGLVLIIQASWNLLLRSIPIMLPMPPRGNNNGHNQ